MKMQCITRASHVRKKVRRLAESADLSLKLYSASDISILIKNFILKMFTPLFWQTAYCAFEHQVFRVLG